MAIGKADGTEAEGLCCTGRTGSIEAREADRFFRLGKSLDKHISRCDTMCKDISQWDISGWGAAVQ